MEKRQDSELAKRFQVVLDRLFSLVIVLLVFNFKHLNLLLIGSIYINDILDIKKKKIVVKLYFKRRANLRN